MVRMSEKSREFLRKYLPKVLEATDPNDILDPLDTLIVSEGLTASQEECNAFGREATEVYDDIFYSNYDD